MVVSIQNNRFCPTNRPKTPFLNRKFDLFLLNLLRLLFFFLPNIILVRCCLFQTSYSLFKCFRVAFFSSKCKFFQNWAKLRKFPEKIRNSLENLIFLRKFDWRWSLFPKNSKNDSSVGLFPIFVQKSDIWRKMIESKLITIPHPVDLVQIWSILANFDRDWNIVFVKRDC